MQQKLLAERLLKKEVLVQSDVSSSDLIVVSDIHIMHDRLQPVFRSAYFC